MLVHGKLSSLGEIQANKLCLIHGNIQLTYGEFAQQADYLAYRLATQINKGDKVLVKLANPVLQLLYFFAILKAGGASILIDQSLTEEVCTELIKIHKISLYINESFQLPAATTRMLPEIDGQDVFLGALTSGSTGNPKLIWRDHLSWTSAFPVQSKVFNISDSDTIYLTGLLVYTANLNACLHLLFEGGTVVIARNSMPRTWKQDIIDRQVTALFMVPANYKSLLKVIKTPLTMITSLVTAGAKIDLKTVQSLVKYFPRAGIFEYYGASELGHVSYSTLDDLLKHPESVGKAFPGVAIFVEDNTIWVESPYIAPAYRPRATVGDLGRLDNEGYLYLLGRKHHVINAGGVKVFPEQVETVLLQCPGITEAVVSGIDDPLRGQKVCAWIVKNNAFLSSTDILNFCRKKMLYHHCPQKIVFVTEIPRNSSGKVDRTRLKNEL